MITKLFGVGKTIEAAISHALRVGDLAAPLRFQVLEQQGEWDGTEMRFTVKLLVWEA